MKYTPVYSYRSKDYTLLNMRLNGAKQILTFKVNAGSNKLRILLTNKHNPHKLKIKHAAVVINNDSYPIRVNNKRSFTMEAYSEYYSDTIEINNNKFNEVKVVVRFKLFNKAYTASDFNSTVVADSRHVGRFNRSLNLGLKTKAINKPHLQIVVLIKQVEFESKAKTITFFGDSLTNHSHYTQVLAQRLFDLNEDIYILNAGISGNRLLRDGENIMRTTFGRSGLTRLEADVFKYNQPDLVVIALGVNDLIHPGSNVSADELPSSAELIEGYKKALKIIRNNNAKAAIATITPFNGFKVTILAEAEVIRNEVNEWIRNQKDFDLVIDIDAIVADENDKSYLAKPFRGDDNLHWDAAGGKIIGDKIDLKALIKLVK